MPFVSTADAAASKVSHIEAERNAARHDRIRFSHTHHLPQLDCCCALACLPDGNLVLANTGGHKLLLVSPDTGAQLGTLGRGVNEGSFRGPRGIVVDSRAKTVFVADCYVRVKQIERERSPGAPTRAYVLNSHAPLQNCVVKKFALADGSLLGIAGSYGEGDGQLRCARPRLESAHIRAPCVLHRASSRLCAPSSQIRTASPSRPRAPSTSPTPATAASSLSMPPASNSNSASRSTRRAHPIRYWTP